jgi:hypothetical protein
MLWTCGLVKQWINRYLNKLTNHLQIFDNRSYVLYFLMLGMPTILRYFTYVRHTPWHRIDLESQPLARWLPNFRVVYILTYIIQSRFPPKIQIYLIFLRKKVPGQTGARTRTLPPSTKYQCSILWARSLFLKKNGSLHGQWHSGMIPKYTSRG